MRQDRPGRRILMGVHRWTGALAAIFLVMLAVTGLCLNHAQSLNLHGVRVSWPFLLKKYNMASAADIESLRIDAANTLSILDNGLYYNGGYVTDCGALTGIHLDQHFLVVVTDEGLILLTAEGELVEVLQLADLPFGVPKLVGIEDSGRPVLVTDTGNWIPDADWLEFTEYGGEFTMQSPVRMETDAATRDSILFHYQGKGPTLYRILLDLHSGRLIGWGGRTIMDLTALAILILAISGISAWRRKPQKPAA